MTDLWPSGVFCLAPNTPKLIFRLPIPFSLGAFGASVVRPPTQIPGCYRSADVVDAFFHYNQFNPGIYLVVLFYQPGKTLGSFNPVDKKERLYIFPG